MAAHPAAAGTVDHAPVDLRVGIVRQVEIRWRSRAQRFGLHDADPRSGRRRGAKPVAQSRQADLIREALGEEARSEGESQQ